MRTFNVVITLQLAPNTTADEAEIDAEELGDHTYESVLADSKEEASEKALDIFHSTVPVGVLDFVEITTVVTENQP